MKRILTATLVAAVTMAVPAAAQAQTANDGWRGCFVGFHLSEKWASTDFTQVAKVGGLIGLNNNFGSQSPSEVGAGGQFGCDYQSGNYVYGLQASHNSAIGGSSVVTAFPTFSIRSQTDSMETVTARFGYMFQPDLMAYVRGGVAMAFDRYAAYGTTPPPTFLSESASRVAIGYAIGGGLEWSIDENFSVFGEFLHADFGSASVPFTQATGTVGLPDIIKIKQSLDQIMIGVNFHF